MSIWPACCWSRWSKAAWHSLRAIVLDRAGRRVGDPRRGGASALDCAPLPAEPAGSARANGPPSAKAAGNLTEARRALVGSYHE